MIVRKKIDFSKPRQRTPEQLKMLEELAKMDDSDIDYSDIPAQTPEQLKEFKRVSDMPERRKHA